MQRPLIINLLLYVDDILLIGNDIATMSTVKLWLSLQFAMNDLGEASYGLSIDLIRDKNKKLIDLYQGLYIDMILGQFNM